jgi:hypothetical protein
MLIKIRKKYLGCFLAQTMSAGSAAYLAVCFFFFKNFCLLIKLLIYFVAESLIFSPSESSRMAGEQVFNLFDIKLFKIKINKLFLVRKNK